MHFNGQVVKKNIRAAISAAPPFIHPGFIVHHSLNFPIPDAGSQDKKRAASSATLFLHLPFTFHCSL
jgi:hypothetical protein